MKTQIPESMLASITSLIWPMSCRPSHKAFALEKDCSTPEVDAPAAQYRTKRGTKTLVRSFLKRDISWTAFRQLSTDDTPSSLQIRLATCHNLWNSCAAAESSAIPNARCKRENESDLDALSGGLGSTFFTLKMLNDCWVSKWGNSARKVASQRLTQWPIRPKHAAMLKSFGLLKVLESCLPQVLETLKATASATTSTSPLCNLYSSRQLALPSTMNANDHESPKYLQVILLPETLANPPVW